MNWIRKMYKKGGRKLKTDTSFLIDNEDLEDFKDDKIQRLMDCLNFTKSKDKFIFHSKDHAEFKGKGQKIIHWLPADDDLIDVEILMPDSTITSGKAEPSIKQVKVDDVVQFERFGFVRCDEIKKDKMIFWFTHK